MAIENCWVWASIAGDRSVGARQRIREGERDDYENKSGNNYKT